MVETPPRMNRPPAYEHQVADFRKNAQERVRVTLHEYRNRDLMSVRVWMDTAGQHRTDQMIPTKKGLTLDITLLPTLIDALNKAQERACAESLLDA